MEALPGILERCDALTGNISSGVANKAIWGIFSFPYFIGHEELSPEQIVRIGAGARNITISIPRFFPGRAPIDYGFFMLWDLLDAFDMVKPLAAPIDHPDEGVQVALLHGLGHQGDGRIPILLRSQNTLSEHGGMGFLQAMLGGHCDVNRTSRVVDFVFASHESVAACGGRLAGPGG